MLVDFRVVLCSQHIKLGVTISSLIELFEMMTTSNRRKLPSEALAVDNALWLARTEGTSPALEYMNEKGIAQDVALRVLGAPQFRRQHRDRRKTRRE